MNHRIRQQLVLLCMGVVFLMLVLSLDQKYMPSKKTAKGAEETETEGQTKTKENTAESLPVENPQIRVLICADNYGGNFHNRVVLKCSGAYQVAYGDVVEEHGADELVTIEPGDPWLAAGAVTLTPLDATATFTMPELKRSYEAPVYSGTFQVEQREEGLLVVNELPLETYLCSVVPSEMPSNYPMEALKAQAVCARTYARKQISSGRGDELGVDVDDSVSYQVYNNIPGDERTTQAVQETAGKVIASKDGSLIDAWYYSTSCGLDLSQDFSQEAVFCASMASGNSQAYEKDEPWYRWSASYTLEELTRLVSLQKPDFGIVTGMYVKDREKNGAIHTLVLQSAQGEYEVEGEYAVRKLLQTDYAGVTLQDGSQAPNLGMLPSAFFYLTPINEGETLTGYQLTGGGYGHGNGMSQNGAKHMAEAGKNYQEILKYYYGDVSVR